MLIRKAQFIWRKSRSFLRDGAVKPLLSASPSTASRDSRFIYIYIPTLVCRLDISRMGKKSVSRVATRFFSQRWSNHAASWLVVDISEVSRLRFRVFSEALNVLISLLKSTVKHINFSYYYDDCARISSLSHHHVHAMFCYKDNVCAFVIFCTEDLTQQGSKYQYNENGLINTRQLMNPFKQGCRKGKKKNLVCLMGILLLPFSASSPVVPCRSRRDFPVASPSSPAV